ncbi:MAG: DUF1653 domain-containing protein [Acetobacter sp.]|nr:DUF1653 domain-containing protein [Acetobacter sp.]
MTVNLNCDIPQAGELFSHYKTETLYRVVCVSKAGNKEDNTLYVTYCEKNGGQLYTRTLDDFLAQIDSKTTRFCSIGKPAGR